MAEYTPFLLQKMREAFAFFDVNKDGVLDVDDMIALADGVSKKTGATEKQAERTRQELIPWVTHLQSNSDRPLNEENFLEGHANLRKDLDSYKRLIRSSVGHVFDVIDIDGDGLISPQELHIFYEAVGITDNVLTKQAFDNIDKNGDGMIQREELVEDVIRHHCNRHPVEGKAYFILGV